MASLEKTSANLENSFRRTIGGFAFFVVVVSSIVVVNLATTGNPRTKQESP